LKKKGVYGWEYLIIHLLSITYKAEGHMLSLSRKHFNKKEV